MTDPALGGPGEIQQSKVVIVIATLLGSAGLYLLLAGQVDGGELIATAIVVCIAVPYALAVRHTATAPMRVPGRAALSLLRALAALALESWRVATALVAAIRRRPDGMQGVVAPVPFRFGSGAAADIGRRASVVTAISLAPNGFALDFEANQDILLVHQLVAAPIGNGMEWPL